MVSAGYTEISLHIRPGQFQFSTWVGGGVFLGSQNSKCQDLPKFQFGGGVFLGSQNSKCQDLPKFQLGGGGRLFLGSQKCHNLPKFQFSVGWGWG